MHPSVTVVTTAAWWHTIVRTANAFIVRGLKRLPLTIA